MCSPEYQRMLKYIGYVGYLMYMYPSVHPSISGAVTSRQQTRVEVPFIVMDVEALGSAGLRVDLDSAAGSCMQAVIIQDKVLLCHTKHV